MADEASLLNKTDQEESLWKQFLAFLMENKILILSGGISLGLTYVIGPEAGITAWGMQRLGTIASSSHAVIPAIAELMEVRFFRFIFSFLDGQIIQHGVGLLFKLLKRAYEFLKKLWNQTAASISSGSRHAIDYQPHYPY